MKTLRARVLVGTTATVAVVLCVAGWALYTLVARALTDEVDRGLTATAGALASAVAQDGGQLVMEWLEFDLEEFADPELGEFLALYAGDHLLYRFPEGDGELPGHPVAGEHPTSAWLELAPGVPGRVMSYPFQPRIEEEEEPDEAEAPEPDEVIEKPPSAAAHLTLVMAGGALGAARTLATLRVLLVGVGLATLLAAGGVLLLVVRGSLRPVAQVADEVAAIGEDSLAARLDPTGVPGELLPVVERVNDLLVRLEAAFERERGFSNDVAHELRTPLAGLRATLEVTARRSRTPEEYAVALHDSTQLVQDLQAMVERLLELARLESSRPGARNQHYVLGDVAVEAWEPFAQAARSRELSVDFTVEDGVDVESDRELIEVILRNLYDNAVTYSDQGGAVRIATARVDGVVSLEVANTGCQLGPDEAGAATQRFWRGDSARTEAGLHCGLGLALVEKAAGALDGAVELSAHAGGEFTVVVRFPA